MPPIGSKSVSIEACLPIFDAFSSVPDVEGNQIGLYIDISKALIACTFKDADAKQRVADIVKHTLQLCSDQLLVGKEEVVKALPALLNPKAVCAMSSTL